MRVIMNIIGWPLGWLMWLIYRFIPSYGWSIILFTVIAKLLMLPLSITQHKSSIKMQQMQPMINDIQNKYKNNTAKMNEELQALYTRENYKMSAGCLPLVITMVLLFGVIDVVYRPLTHILRIGKETITAMGDVLTANSVSFTSYTKEITMISGVHNNPAWFSSISPETINSITKFDTSFLGMDLSMSPTQLINWSNPSTIFPIILIPVLSGLTALLVSLHSMKNTAPSAGASSTKALMYTMPLISLWFTFGVPMGVGIYWILGNVISLLTNVVLFKVWNPKEAIEKIKQAEEERKERERLEKIEAKKRAKEAGEDESSLSQKEINRRKLKEARKRSAEKYGDVYIDDEE